jgi:hypothetical protein
LGKGYGGVGSKGHAAELPSDPIKEDEAFATAVGNAERQARKALVEMLDLARDWRLDPIYTRYGKGAPRQFRFPVT